MKDAQSKIEEWIGYSHNLLEKWRQTQIPNEYARIMQELLCMQELCKNYCVCKNYETIPIHRISSYLCALDVRMRACIFMLPFLLVINKTINDNQDQQLAI
ncbi:hypothetical protein LOAG_05525 [Loa loa]|uniref:Uncharacterized protein n=1 Tax=Loa loa TaxID=7209 RepID=A0A1S0U044_LOALO|nr:hypothetical protein LOAG_05525 [Loa loa]EFO22962.1 hypothetical protein LOAG_05525 [Loa loa]